MGADITLSKLWVDVQDRLVELTTDEARRLIVIVDGSVIIAHVGVVD